MSTGTECGDKINILTSNATDLYSMHTGRWAWPHSFAGSAIQARRTTILGPTVMIWRACPGGERYRYRANWVTLQAFCTLIGVSFYIALPSLHQFVTSSTHPDDASVSPPARTPVAIYSSCAPLLEAGVNPIGITIVF